VTDVAQQATANAPAAGWYPDPADPSAKRWWSGQGWTDHVQSAPVAPVPVTVQPDAPLPVVAETPVAVPASVVEAPVVQAVVVEAPAVPPPAPAPVVEAPATPAPIVQPPVVVAPAATAAPLPVVAPAPSYAAPAAYTAPPAYTAPVIPQPVIPQQVAQPVAPALKPRNVDADGVPLNLFADSVFTPDVLTPPAPRPDTQSDWHNRGGRSTTVRRQSGGSVSLSTSTQTGAARKHNPYERNWIAGVALVIAIFSVPALGMRTLVDLPPLSQSIFAGAPIAIALLALVTSIRRSAGIVVSSIAVVIAGGVLAAGLLVDPAILKSLVDSILALLP
jgi:hypothetical protein